MKMSIGELTLSIACGRGLNDTTRTQFLSPYYCADSSVRTALLWGWHRAHQFQILHPHNLKANRIEKQIYLFPDIPTTSLWLRLARIPMPDFLLGPSNTSALMSHVAPPGAWRIIIPT